MHRTLTLIVALAFTASMPSLAVAASNTEDAEASFTSTLSTKDTTPSLSGDASGTKFLFIEVLNDDGKKVFSKKNIRVNKDRWKTTVSKKLKEGDYEVSVYDTKKSRSSLLATTTLTVLGKNSSAGQGGTISVSQLPLLMGGVAVPGTASPVAYVMVKNTGAKATSINGITLVETGSIDDSVVTGFTTNDDKGGSRATSTVMFKNGKVTVPLKAEIAAGQTRIFTVKALISPNKILYGNKELRINVAGIDSSAKVSGALPLIGTVWVLR